MSGDAYPGLNRKIAELCAPYTFPRELGYENHGVLPPMFYPAFRPGGVLYVGINPSISRGEQKTFDQQFPNPFPPDHDFTEDEIDGLAAFQKEQHGERHGKGEKLTVRPHNYFATVYEVANGIEWIRTSGPLQFFDIFPLRCTKQTEFLNYRNRQNAGKNTFDEKFIRLLHDLVDAVKPKLLWVANKAAHAILLKNGWDLKHKHKGRILDEVLIPGISSPKCRAYFFARTVTITCPVLVTNQLSGKSFGVPEDARDPIHQLLEKHFPS